MVEKNHFLFSIQSSIQCFFSSSFSSSLSDDEDCSCDIKSCRAHVCGASVMWLQVNYRETTLRLTVVLHANVSVSALVSLLFRPRQILLKDKRSVEDCFLINFIEKGCTKKHLYIEQQTGTPIVPLSEIIKISKWVGKIKWHSTRERYVVPLWKTSLQDCFILDINTLVASSHSAFPPQQQWVYQE